MLLSLLKLIEFSARKQTLIVLLPSLFFFFSVRIVQLIWSTVEDPLVFEEVTTFLVFQFLRNYLSSVLYK